MSENSVDQGHCRLFVQKDEHKFSCAHMTVFADGTKERMHGHNFRVALALELPIEQKRMLDFARLKMVLGQLCSELREHVLIAADCPQLRIRQHDAVQIDFELCGQHYVLPAQDVLLLPMDNVIVETLATWIWKRVFADLAAEFARCEVRRLELTVTEAPGQGATFSLPIGV